MLKLNLFLLLAIALALVSCQKSTPDLTTSPEEEKRLDTQLVLNNAILEQSNQQNNTIWKIKANSIVYSEDQKTANLEGVVANLLQDGKIILKIRANQGEVRDNGNLVILQKQIVASDPRNGSIIETDLVEWRPQENLLLIKQDLIGIHSNLQVKAQTGKYLTDRETLEIEGNVVATTEQPALQLTSDRLIWNVSQDEIQSPGAVTIVRYDTKEQVTERLVGDRAKVNLTTNIASLTGNIELVALQPKIQAATESLIWNYQQRRGKSEQPLQIVARDRQVTLTGNRGEIDLQQQIAKLQDGVKGIDQQRQSELYARQLNWKIDTQIVEATGNVIYEQIDPQARLTGEKAIGTWGKNNIIVTSEGKKQVKSVISNQNRN